jgi:hypothetical protein
MPHEEREKSQLRSDCLIQPQRPCAREEAFLFGAERGHPGRSGFELLKRVGSLWAFTTNRCCCGQDGRAPVNA